MMTRIMEISKLEDTILWKRLAEDDGVIAQALSGNLVIICKEASDRMKAMRDYAPQYTLHDETHLLRTTELMGLILDDKVSELNIIELALLILAAFFHDQGMIPTRDQYFEIRKSPEFQLHKDKWMVEHPNYGEITKKLGDLCTSEPEKRGLSGKIAELDSGMFTDFLRDTHARRSAEFVRAEYNDDKRFDVLNVNISNLLATLCESHSFPAASLVPGNGFRFDEQIATYTINMPYLAVVLRLADILDFDRDRAPETLFRSIHFNSMVSLQEWEKHRSVQGWKICDDMIRFTMKSKHPVYEASAHQFMDWIDAELASCQDLLRSQPAEFSRYQLNLPSRVDRTRIEPLDNAYRCHDLEFKLSRDDIVRLLMTDKLYSHPHLCIRELLQNSLDALRYRKALFASGALDWHDGHVKFKHFVDDNGYEVIQCSDNGSGMDTEILRNHFIKIGRSFYRAPEFERERARLRATGNDFDPCSRFGIGFMSCFMLGDDIAIETRRDYGPGRELGPPLIVEIHGLSGLLVMRDGRADQEVGTTVSIVSRKKPSFLDSWHDNVQLIAVIKGYALATEFPIKAHCEVPELSNSVTIPAHPEKIETLLESAGVHSIVTLEQDLLEVDNYLHGMVRESFLVNEGGLPCLENSEAQWIAVSDKPSKEWALRILAEDRNVSDAFKHESVPVCVDGILVAGPPGRWSYRGKAERRLGSRNSHIYSKGPALIDARGDLKPELTPGRVPPEGYPSTRIPGWQRLNEKFNQGLGLLWGQVAKFIDKGLDAEQFWRLAVVHEIWVPCIPHQNLWDLVSISIIDHNAQCSWNRIRDLGELTMSREGDSGFEFLDVKGRIVGPSKEFLNWAEQGAERLQLDWHMNSTVLLMSGLDVRNGKAVFRPTPPSDSYRNLSQFAISDSMISIGYFLTDYVGSASSALAVETPFPTANRNHPLSVVGHKARYAQEQNDLEQFAASFIPCISRSISPKDKDICFEKPGYWHKLVAHKYFSVQWDRYDNSLKPPYRVWNSQGGWFDIEETDLAHWKDSSASLG